jgi:UDP-N-acetylmuramoyl-tripeptide--D-alanyl-D-alanine ligase
MLTGRRDVTVVTFGVAEEADLRLTDIQHSMDGLRITINDRDVYQVPMIGRHNAGNAAAAIAAGRRMGLDAQAINAGLAKVKAPEHRLQRMMIGGVFVLDDAYNANPESMRAAIETFAEIAVAAPRRVVVLGDMLELGPESALLHREIGKHVADCAAADVAMLVGPLSEQTARAITDASSKIAVRHFAQASPSTFEAIARTFRPGDAVLLKGSRGMALDRVAVALRAMHPENDPPTMIVTPKSAAATR